jgi:hypothetical protein
MRSGYPAAVLCLALAALGAQLACAQNAPPAAPASPAAPAPTLPAAQAAPPDAGSEAAERHAKRTACIKDAKTKKLHGPDKTAYIKTCASAG